LPDVLGKATYRCVTECRWQQSMLAEFAPLIAKYGYAATFVGTLLEGETFLVLSGLAANRGYLGMPQLIAVGAAGAILTDNLFFAIGRALGPALLKRFPRLAPSAARAHALVERLPNTAVIGVRFLYGMRSVGPAVIGSGTMKWSRFVLLDTLAASLWSACWVGAGYVLGEAVEQLLREFTSVGAWLVAGAAAASALVASILYLRQRKRRG
jgi:membrane protein DedA with SNARE-associated domain